MRQTARPGIQSGATEKHPSPGVTSYHPIILSFVFCFVRCSHVLSGSTNERRVTDRDPRCNRSQRRFLFFFVPVDFFPFFFFPFHFSHISRGTGRSLRTTYVPCPAKYQQSRAIMPVCLCLCLCKLCRLIILYSSTSLALRRRRR